MITSRGHPESLKDPESHVLKRLGVQREQDGIWVRVVVPCPNDLLVNRQLDGTWAEAEMDDLPLKVIMNVVFVRRVRLRKSASVPECPAPSRGAQ